MVKDKERQQVEEEEQEREHRDGRGVERKLNIQKQQHAVGDADNGQGDGSNQISFQEAGGGHEWDKTARR